ncbi:hypothetical protein F4680DRAFT_231837 [Xylaria scruposa]|nr:hypothetical protein F4680DRAFT_231837 [Xylaria scruposa]
MASKKDMRRPDLIVPYQEPPVGKDDSPEFSSTLSSTMPMAAIFTRNKYIGWYVYQAPSFTFSDLEQECRDQAAQDKTIALPRRTLANYDEPPFYRTAVVFSMQSWLGESEATTQSTSTPGYFSVGMSIMALAVTYLPIFMPPVPGQAQPAAPVAA